MEERKSRREVMHALEQELRRDRSPTKLLSVNEFGLVILTRKRVKQSLERLLMQPCPYCSGSGQVKSVGTVCSEIYDEVRKLAGDMRGQRLVLRERLLELPGRVSGHVVVDVEELAALVAVSQRPNWDYLRTRLRHVDEAVATVAVDALAPEEAEALRDEAARAAERHRGRIDEHSLEEAIARLVRQRARERLRLPRVSFD